MKAVCVICPHRCKLSEGGKGLCGARIMSAGKVISESYGKITSIALDPIEKKPLKRFMSGSMILSVGSYGCNLKCPFCQNYSISTECGFSRDTVYLSPQELIAKALDLRSSGNIGVAYTYNEPLIGYEYVYDCAVLARENGLKSVAVTNGYINESPLIKLLPYIDAMNIDLKAFNADFYKKIGGGLEEVKRTIEISSNKCHIEVTTLIIPGENDGEDEIGNLSLWLSSVDRNIPLHISRFFPRYRYQDKLPTPVDKVYRLADIARKHLKYVYTGNC